MNIKHDPLFDTDMVEKKYSELEGVPVRYVCTTAMGNGNDVEPADIFYRETPHPEFGNYYFGLWFRGEDVYIFNADGVIDLDFAMITDSEGFYHYSRSRWDYRQVDNNFIDGGRAYFRGSCAAEWFKIKDGKFEKPLDIK
jgi:hypothetical protein